jgi:hypothetical protein
MKTIRISILIYLGAYLLALLYPFYSSHVFIATFQSLEIGRPFEEIATQLQTDHRTELRRGVETASAVTTNTLRFFGAADDAINVTLVTQSGILTSKAIVGSTAAEKEMKSWSWITAYFKASLRTILPLGCLYFLVWKGRRLKWFVKAPLWFGVLVGGVFAAIDLIWLGLIYAILVARLII